MAFRDSTDNPVLPMYYNVTMAVGSPKNAPNRRDDVLLVQYFLREIYRNPLGKTSFQKPKGVMVADGWWGPVTARWVLHFQQESRNAGKPVACDQRVDRCLTKSGISTISETLYTILRLNIDFRMMWPDVFPSLETAVNAPAELRAALAGSAVVLA